MKKTKKDTKNQEVERELYSTKWWDYRHMEPEHATLICLLEYARAFSTYNDRRGNGRHVNVFKNIDFERPETWRFYGALVKVRRWCDRRGVIYKQFWRLAMAGHEELGFRWATMNAFCNGRLLEWVEKDLAQRNAKTLVLSERNRFKAENYCGCPIQKAYYRHVVDEVKRKKGSGPAAVDILKQLIENGRLSKEFLKERAEEK